MRTWAFAIAITVAFIAQSTAAASPAPAEATPRTAAQSSDPKARDSQALEAVVVVGSRGVARTDVDRPVPVDVVDGADLADDGSDRSGAASAVHFAVIQLCQVRHQRHDELCRSGVAARMSPDQVLVLVNGKRRHQFSIAQSQRRAWPRHGRDGSQQHSVRARSNASKCCATVRPRSTVRMRLPASSISC